MSKENVPGTFPLSSPDPTGKTSVDAGTLDLGVDSAWTRGNEVTAGVERSLSQRAEPPTSDQLSSDLWLGALGAPSKLSLSAPGISDDVVGEINKIDATSTDEEINTMPSAHMSWFDLPDDDELGEVPEFPVLYPSVRALESTPQIIEELLVTSDKLERKLGNEKTHRDERTEQWATEATRQRVPKETRGLGNRTLFSKAGYEKKDLTGRY
ncbi:uncharacterized protein HD556DRAFT_1476806 [Suillus plorans]|uniref:Uncharacterized protein n=1 Tax=Suillus plorans TaxID=116603 RepID=A0A9P7DHF0_9AGAM|nr:uncharacterized protein HD556DRAFT_1476806 [Suillus plorans]KAG1793590.1 hypothetical protein HD556DRAFT_1476806 [Suillus plorans]